MSYNSLSAKTVKHLESIGFTGLDRCLEESLFEYGFIARETNEVNELQIIYYFGTHFSKTDVFGYLYVNKSDILEAFEQCKEGLLSFTGLSESEWLETGMIQQYHDISSYQSWFDTNYPTMNKGDLLKLKKFEPKTERIDLPELMDYSTLDIVGDTYSDYTPYRD